MRARGGGGGRRAASSLLRVVAPDLLTSWLISVLCCFCLSPSLFLVTGKTST